MVPTSNTVAQSNKLQGSSLVLYHLNKLLKGLFLISYFQVRPKLTVALHTRCEKRLLSSRHGDISNSRKISRSQILDLMIEVAV